MSGSVREQGQLAMGGPTTSLVFTGNDVSIAGDVYDPPVDPKYKAENCMLLANQDGNNVSGFLCDRKVNGFSGF
jgi:hypothetical protein